MVYNSEGSLDEYDDETKHQISMSLISETKIMINLILIVDIELFKEFKNKKEYYKKQSKKLHASKCHYQDIYKGFGLKDKLTIF